MAYQAASFTAIIGLIAGLEGNAVTEEALSRQSGWVLTRLVPGALVAGYRVEPQIRAGGMAVVLRARDEALGRTVALKVLAPALAEDKEFRERFIRESRSVAAVDHLHIIPVYAAGEAGGVLYLAMRFVSGGDLRSLVAREGQLTGDQVVALLSPIASALVAAHAAGLVHRDVKPANILVDSGPGRQEHPYLSDFGLAKRSASATSLTETGQFVGTLDYAAPEQIAGRRALPQTDQYALACVAFTALTGSLPFDRAEPMAVLWAHMYEPPPSVCSRRATCRPRWTPCSPGRWPRPPGSGTGPAAGSWRRCAAPSALTLPRPRPRRGPRPRPGGRPLPSVSPSPGKRTRPHARPRRGRQR